jgi:haloalkane dehalogenase
VSTPIGPDTDTRRPSWVDDRLFPFRSRWLDIAGNTVHYVDEGSGDEGSGDEGSGPTLLMLHGNPMWSFLFRDLITALRPAFRCIALDYPGFGLSRAATGFGFTPAEHAAVVTSFVRALDLRDVTLFGQDWGGPIGLAAAQRDPTRYAGLVLGNTRAWPPLTESERRSSLLLDGLLGELLIVRSTVFLRRLVPRLAHRRPLGRAELAHVTSPFRRAADRRPIKVFVGSITRETDFLGDVQRGLPALAGLPVLILWATMDRGFPSENRVAFEKAFPHHTTVLLADTGHFLWQDAPDLVVSAFRRWWHDRAPRGGDVP